MKTVLAVGAVIAAVVWWGNPFAGTSGSIVPQHGIDGVRIGQTMGQVMRVLGEPEHVRRGRNALGRFRRLEYQGVTVMMQGRRHVTKVWTSSDEHRTDDGVGVGSSRDEVEDAIDRIDCDPVREGSDTARCVLGRVERRRVATVFFLDKDRVTRVIVKRVQT